MATPKNAIITGITGQDGCYLSQLLLEKGYRVLGVIDPKRNSSLWGLKFVGALEQVTLLKSDLNDYTDVQRLILQHEPDEVYHLAAQSSVSQSFQMPLATMEINTRPVIHLLEAIRTLSPQTKLYHASSSEMFGTVERLPVDEQTLFHPVSPYAVSKVASHQTVTCYRESYDLFAVSGILFNHESVLRGQHFFTRKLITQAMEIARGERDSIVFGNLDVKRDFGYAPAYVEAMWRMLQHDSPYDFLICSGHSVRLRDIVERVFERLEISTEKIVVDPALFRPNEIQDMFGSNDRAKQELSWGYDLTPLQMIDRLVEDYRNAFERLHA